MSEAEERYLAAIGRLQGADGGASVAALVEELGLRKGTVSEMLDRLADGGLVQRGARGAATLLEPGRREVERLTQRRSLVERFLTEVLEVAPADLDDVADRLAQVVSPRLEERMSERLAEKR